MIALRLVHLIESHSDLLAENLLRKLQYSARSADFRRVPEAEVRERVYAIYRNLSDWLLNKTDTDIKHVYTHLGYRRASQGVSMSALCWSIMMTEENLWDFLESQGLRESVVDILGHLELLRMLDQFYDRAVYYAIVGYENYNREMRAETVAEMAHAA
jgi:hypothetical protein